MRLSSHILEPTAHDDVTTRCRSQPRRKASSLTKIRARTLDMLITTAQLTMSLPTLPEKCGISMKLLYYDDKTPDDYEPPGFYSVDSSSFSFPSDPLNCILGEVTTPFHSLKLNAKLEGSRIHIPEAKKNSKINSSNSQEEIAMESQPTQPVYKSKAAEGTNKDISSDKNDAGMTGNIASVPLKGVKSAVSKSSLRQPAENVAIPMYSPAQPESALTADLSTELCITPSEVREAGVRCACGVEKDGGLMVKCEICNQWQHGFCYGLFEQKSSSSHICEKCHGEKHPCTDPQLLLLSIQQRQEVCLYRRTLMFVTQGRVTPCFIAQELDVSGDISQLLFDHLEKDGILKPSRCKGNPRSVNLKFLKNEIMPRYFGPFADLKAHDFIFKTDHIEAMDCNEKHLEEIHISTRETRKRRQTRAASQIGFNPEEDEKPSSKRQKVSQSSRI
ncbi:uncharacterized protein [Periplaneta americana]|uniref:uncharacterized protein isoform X2 n=1 Tax=Periplaneta americana TaxID=6978 RepID=UPI0037E93FE7